MSSILLFNKPFRVLSQFTDSEGRATLADYLEAPRFRAAGRLDYDSEGLLLLTDNGSLQQQIANPRYKHWKTYLVQVEGTPSAGDLLQMGKGVRLKDGLSLPARVRAIPPPDLWPRDPPIRHREQVPVSWLELSLREGRNRQVRRMTAALGYPTLRLVRTRVGDWSLDGLAPGQSRAIEVHLPVKPAPGRPPSGRRRA